MSYAPGAPELIWAIPDDVLDDGAKLTLMRLWSKADHAVQQAPAPCDVWSAARPDHTPTQALHADLAEARGCSVRKIRRHLTKLRALGLAEANGRLVRLTPPANGHAVTTDGQDCPSAGDRQRADRDRQRALADRERASADRKGSAHLNPPVPSTPPTPAVEARDVDQYGIAAPTAEERDMVYGDLDALAEQLPPPPPPRAQARQPVTPKPSSVVNSTGAPKPMPDTRTVGERWNEVTMSAHIDRLDAKRGLAPKAEDWRDIDARRKRELAEGNTPEAKLHAVSPAAAAALATSDANSAKSWSSLRDAAKLSIGFTDAAELAAYAKWESTPWDERPPMGKFWWFENRPWVEREALGITSTPAAKPRAGHFQMRGSLAVVP